MKPIHNINVQITEANNPHVKIQDATKRGSKYGRFRVALRRLKGDHILIIILFYSLTSLKFRSIQIKDNTVFGALRFVDMNLFIVI